MKPSELIDAAASYARFSDMQQHRLGAIIIPKRGGTPAPGFNVKKTHPRFGTRSIHAEMRALLNAARYGISTYGATIYVARPRRCGDYGLAKPCPTCLSLLSEAGLIACYYTTPTGIEKISL